MANKPAGFKVGGWGHPEYLSGGSWLFAGIDGKDAADLPAAGLTFDFPFESKSTGENEVWARVGYEAVRSPMKSADRRRLPGARMQAARRPHDRSPDEPARLERGRLGETRLGRDDARQTCPSHPFRAPRSRRQEAAGAGAHRARLLLHLEGAVHAPNGRFKLGRRVSRRQGQGSREARASAWLQPAKGPRTTLPLKGLWEISPPIADEGEIVDRTEAGRLKLPKLERAVLEGRPGAGQSRCDSAGDDVRAHRFLYRTKVFVPADRRQARPSCSASLRRPRLLRSSSTASSVPRQLDLPCAAWDADVTRAIPSPARRTRDRRRDQGPLLRDREDRRRQVGPHDRSTIPRAGSIPAATAAALPATLTSRCCCKSTEPASSRCRS